jgi:tetratricopeptide (TPR) repeat protein
MSSFFASSSEIPSYLEKIKQDVKTGETEILIDINRFLAIDTIPPIHKALLHKYKGGVFRLLDSFSLAQKEYYKALRLSEGSGDFSLQAKIHNNIANLFVNLGDFKNALKHYNKSLAIFEEENDERHIAATLMNLGVLYENQDKFDKALAVYKRALELDSIRRSTRARLLLNQGACLLNLGQYELAQSSLLKAQAIFNELELVKEANKAAYNLAYTYELLGQYNKALDIYLSSYKSSLEEKQTQFTIDCVQGIMLIYNLKREPDSVQKYYYLLHDYKEDLYKNKLDKGIYEVQTAFEVEKKDQEIITQRQLKNKEKRLKKQAQKTAAAERKAKQQTTWILSLIIIATLILLGSISLSLVQKNKIKKLQIDQHEKEIGDLIQQQEQVVYQTKLESENKERKRLANELHDRVGGLLAAVNLHVENLQEGNQKEKLSTVQGLVKDSISEIRSISHNLGDSIHTGGLRKSLENFAEGISSSGRIQMETYFSLGDKEPSQEVSNQIFTIV